MTTFITQQPEAQTQGAAVGNLEAPSITSLGSLDDSQGTAGLGLSAVSMTPVFAIIYNGS